MANMKTPNGFRYSITLHGKKCTALTAYLPLLIVSFILMISETSGQVGVHTDTPHTSSAMDIVASDRGLLIPRVTLSNNLSNPSPVSSPATGLLVFNTGSNQPVGLYYWDGSQWNPSSGSSDFWSLTGNGGTTPGVNYLGTTDAVDFVVFTNKSERMRFESDGQVIVGATAAYDPADLFTVVANSTQSYAINAYSPNTGFYSNSGYAGFYNSGGAFGLVSIIDTADGYSVYGRNHHASGYGSIFAGSGSPAYTLNDHTAGLSSSGNDGIFSIGIASGGAGVIGVGSGIDTAYTINDGCGGAFSGNHGVYGKAYSSTSGTGVIGVGGGVSNFNSSSDGSGGAFTGYHGVYATGVSSSGGYGIIAAGNSGSVYSFSSGGGGAFTGAGTGVAGWGTASGSRGGYFTGSDGRYHIGTEASDGTGVIGAGNDESPFTLSSGSGGAFTGEVCGIFAYATSIVGDRYGGYFYTGGNRYAFVGGRYSGTNRKIVGNGTVSTIVKNSKGEAVTLVCPEAPETVFQDFGIGQLVDGRAHVVIDPDLAININVSEDHPLKVYITPEGDCKGLYVTNKSANGFDVIELQGGTSNIPFSWQIVATRANEEYRLEDGTIETSDYSQRFQPAPPPLKMRVNEKGEKELIISDPSSARNKTESNAIRKAPEIKKKQYFE